MSDKSECLLSGAWGSGKTRALCEKTVKLCVENPGNRVGLFRKEGKALEATTLVTLLEGDGSMPPVLPPEAIIKHIRRPYGRIVIRTQGDPSEIVYGGLTQKSVVKSWVKGLNLGGFCVDQMEELDFSDYMLLLGRIRLDVPKIRQACGACNPGSPSHWIHERFFDSPDKNMWVGSSSSFDNPFLPEQYRNSLSRLRGRYYQRYALGLWIGFEGLIYPNFDPKVHVIPRFDIPVEWTRFLAVDFGYVHPACAQLWAWDPKADILYLDKEIYVTQKFTVDLAKEIKSLWGKRVNPAKVVVIADHDAEECAVFRREGFRVIPADKRVKEGIQKVYARVGNEQELPEDKRSEPSLFFFEDALEYIDETLAFAEEGVKFPCCTVDEMQVYEWLKEKEIPRKKFDHGMDTTRYTCMTAFSIPEEQKREVKSVWAPGYRIGKGLTRGRG